MSDEEPQNYIPKSNFQKVLSLAKALLTGKQVSRERVEKRLEICQQCPLVKARGDSSFECSICGCKLGSDTKNLINLARYEETNDHGCFFPGVKGQPRDSKWKREGV